MSEQSDPRSEGFKRARDEFEQLGVEDKAVFLLEATVSTIARGVEKFGKTLSEEIEKAFTRCEEAVAEDEAEAPEANDEPAAAEKDAGKKAEKKKAPPKKKKDDDAE